MRLLSTCKNLTTPLVNLERIFSQKSDQRILMYNNALRIKNIKILILYIKIIY